MIQPPPPASGETPRCEWVPVDEDGPDFETSCGQAFQSLTYGAPTFVKFCCYCGRPVTHVPFEVEHD